MSLEKTTQDLTVHSMRIHGSITVRSIDCAIDRIDQRDVDGRKTRIATYTFYKKKT